MSSAPSPIGIACRSRGAVVQVKLAGGNSAGARPVSTASRNKARSRSASNSGSVAAVRSRSACARATSSRVPRPASRIRRVSVSVSSCSRTVRRPTLSCSVAEHALA
jgi:hypothetical protein